MKRRCQNENDKDYHNYGGRGIVIYKPWSNFLVFRKWALDNGYTEELTIEHKDTNGNYEPSNCKFIPRSEQSRNRRNSKEVNYGN